MIKQSVYTSTILAKNGTTIPVFSDGKTVDSRYNPEREADKITNSMCFCYKDKIEELGKENLSVFFVVIGIASGVLIKRLSETFPSSIIVGLEISNEDINFLSTLSIIKELKQKNNVLLTDISNIENILTNNYLPAIYSDLKVVEQLPWVWENNQYVEIINKKLNKAIGIVSADFSVQSHFGKIWQSNILNNLKAMSCAEHKEKVFSISKENLSKTAVVVAAGPSLDKSISNLKNKRDHYFIIATDTAFSVLLKNNIIADIVVSIDGQHISHNHFFETYDNSKSDIIKENTLFLLDLCSDSSLTQYLLSKNYNVSYFISGHPLSTLANNLSKNKFIYLFSGAGTVTITSLDLALKLGFSDIEIYGADFAYINGKSYAKGTYFDTLFNITSSKLKSFEYQFSKLMYRTELVKSQNNEYFTAILDAYRVSLEQYLTDNKCIYNRENHIYTIKNRKSNRIISSLVYFNYNFEHFIKEISSTNLIDLKYPLLPYVAWLKNKNDDASLKFIALLKLAQYNIVRYN